MPFTEDIVRDAWDRAGGRCECARGEHSHNSRCGKRLAWENRGQEYNWGAWQAHHVIGIARGGEDTLDNCEVLCWECLGNLINTIV
jgi:hypothetical protein